MTPEDIVFTSVGCCNEYRRAMVDRGDGLKSLVTDNLDGTYAVVDINDGMMVGGSERTISAVDEVY